MKKIAQKVTLGEFLKSAREEMHLSLRDVEEEKGISNAYLSQLEGNKIKKPSPVVLHKLSSHYQKPYSVIMKLAGYPVPEISDQPPGLYSRIGTMTKDEEDKVVEYLAFLRSRRK